MSVLILGAGSDIAVALARAYAAQGQALILAARDVSRLETDAGDLRIRFAVPVRLVAFDVLDAAAFVESLGDLPEVVICVVGLLGSQQQAETDAVHADLVMRTNYNGPALVLNDVAARMAARGAGLIIGISSVAGDRGRASNYVYGSAKAGFTAFLSGLRNRLARSGVRVITVKPGFVNTRMTAGMKLQPLLTAEPAEVATAILRAQAKGRDVIYVRPVWRLILLIIQHLPEFVFKKTKL